MAVVVSVLVQSLVLFLKAYLRQTEMTCDFSFIAFLRKMQ